MSFVKLAKPDLNTPDVGNDLTQVQRPAKVEMFIMEPHLFGFCIIGGIILEARTNV